MVKIPSVRPHDELVYLILPRTYRTLNRTRCYLTLDLDRWNPLEWDKHHERSFLGHTPEATTDANKREALALRPR